MSYFGVSAEIIYSDYQATLLNGSEIDSGWLDMQGVDKVQFSGNASVSGMTMTIDSRANPSQTAISTPVTYTDGSFYLFNIICRQRYMRFKWTNNTGASVTNVSMEIKQTFGSSDKLSVFPVGVNPSVFSQAALVQSINRGQQPDGDYVAVPADGTAISTSSALGIGASYTSSWIDSDGYNELDLLIATVEVSAEDGIVVDFTDDANAGSPTTVFSRTFSYNQEDIDRGFLRISLPPALDGFRVSYTNGPTAQTSFFLVVDLRINGSPQRLNAGGSQVVSDFGVEVALGEVPNYQLGTVTGRNSDIDTASTPEDITEIGGVYTGQPESYTPETVTATSSSVNDTAVGTGARTIRIHGLKTSSSKEYETEDMTLLNGVSVTSTNTWWRVNKVEVLTAGSGGENDGVITISASITTSVVFAAIPAGYNQSQVCAYTVPNSKKLVLKRLRTSITRANGSAGSATICLLTRKSGEVFRCIRIFELQTGGGASFTFEGGIVLDEGTDIKFQVKDVSDNNTVAEAAVEYYLINC